MIGIVLAGGSGTRLHPLTRVVSKQLLPVYDKPMIHYPISTLMLAGIKDIVIITSPSHQSHFKALLGNGKQFGANFDFVIQNEPKGIAEAFILAENFIEGQKTALILGDNIFHGTSLGTQLSSFQDLVGAQIFGYHVSNPSEYGVVTLNQDGSAREIHEKPSAPTSSLAIPGLYFYDETVLEKARSIEMSARGELEITTINQMYLEEKRLNVSILPRGTAWLDARTFETLFEATSFVRVLQERQGYKIACLEEIALRMNWINELEFKNNAELIQDQKYKSYLYQVLEDFIH